MPDVGAGHEGDLAFGVIVAEEDEDRFSIFVIKILRRRRRRGGDVVAFAGGVDNV